MLELIHRFNGKIRLRLIGNFYPPELKEESSLHPGWAYVDWFPRLPFEQLSEHLKGALAGLVLEHGTPNHIDAYPTKLFDYMGSSLPVIANDVPLWAGIIKRANCGYSVRFNDIDTLQECVESLISDEANSIALGNNARAAIVREFNWENEAEALGLAYLAVCKMK
jgi:glycosyltransferase involved in cell wall biosynthesis